MSNSSAWGGSRKGAGRPQTTYKLTATPAKQLHELAKKRGMHPDALLTQLIADAARQDTHPSQDAVNQLLQLLTPEPQTVATICKRLRMQKPELQQLISQHYEKLLDAGLHLHVATASESNTINIPGGLNATEPRYYSKLSRNLLSFT